MSPSSSSPTPDDFYSPAPQAGAVQARDQGLRRAHRLTRWIAVAAVAGAAALGGLYTHLLPGGSASPAPPAGPSVQQPASASSAAVRGDDGEHGDDHEGGDDEGEGGNNAQPAPQPPAQPPAATQQQPQATTGAS